MFSKTCQYAIRAVIFISKKSSEGQRVGIKEIATGIDSPEHFIAKILQDLSKRRLISSFKGPNGGFFIEDDSSCTIADIVKAIDGDTIFSGCGLGLAYCSESKPCPIHYEFKAVRDELSRVLNNAKVNLFNENLIKSLTYLKQR